MSNSLCIQLYKFSSARAYSVAANLLPSCAVRLRVVSNVIIYTAINVDFQFLEIKFTLVSQLVQYEQAALPAVQCL